MITIKKYVFGYGSLINIESASKALCRNLSENDIIIAKLNNYQRNWSLWDNVYSLKLKKNVRGVYLNIVYNQGFYINGILIEVNDDELKNLIIREKNYDCVDITKFIDTNNNYLLSNCKVFSFVGKNSYTFIDSLPESYIFQNYIEIVNTGLISISKDFYEEFYKTTAVSDTPILDGPYTFIDWNQQKMV